MDNEYIKILESLFAPTTILLSLLGIPLIVWGIIKIFVARREAIEKFRKERENLRNDVRNDLEGT